MSKYFDFHLHPVFKNYITNFDKDYPTKRSPEDILTKVHVEHGLIRMLDQEFLHLLSCQACVEQMQETGEAILGMAAIASVERCFSGRRGLFAKILTTRRSINPLDHKYMDKIRNGDISYYFLFLKELDLYEKLRKSNYITILSRKNPASLKDLKGIYLTISMEGGHCLCRTKIRNAGEYDETPEIENADALYKDLIKNKKVDSVTSLKLLQQAMWDEDMDLFYLTLTHLSFIKEAHLATHAFGMKMIKEPSIYPVGEGLTKAGKQIIDAAYNMKVKVDGKTVEAPIYIDIKHMSLKSRLDFYELRREKGYEMPIIVTHAGVTGYNIQEWVNACQRAFIPRRIQDLIGIRIRRKQAGEWGGMHRLFTFNAWSINLMNEDIVEVLGSSGLIGVTLDVRILGWQDIVSQGDKIEYITIKDFAHFFPGRKTTYIPSVIEEEIYEEKVKSKSPAPSREERHPLSFCFNILHIVSIGKQSNSPVDPWKHICIGSDFDGLIKPLVNCRNVRMFPELEKNMLKWMPVAERAYRAKNDGPELLVKNDQGEPDMEDLKMKVRDIMYYNGKRFVQNWLYTSKNME